jgi:predicted metalloprotease with PDZ domain
MRTPHALAMLLLTAAPAAAQVTRGNSAPAATAPFADTIPAAEDRAYPGTMRLLVDARNVTQGFVDVTQTIPVTAAGPLVLLYPKWLPGTHAPEGQPANLAGLSFTVNGKPLAWTRDPLDMTAFHIVVPAGARAVEARFQYLDSPEPMGIERRTMTPAMMNLQWEKMSLYPAGYYVRQIPVTAALRVPEGWTAYTALRGKQAGGRTTYETVAYDTLVDSPVFAGKHAQSILIGKDVRLNIVGDTEAAIAPTDEQVDLHRNLVTQADKLFGARHYDRYDFLLAVSDQMSGIGLEHHRSSENAVGADLFSNWKANIGSRDLLPHEYVHSWNGKFRRGADLWTPDYRTPMRDSMLWVYEGLTSFFGPVLAARSGLWSKDEFLGWVAATSATYAEAQPGQVWRSIADTTNDPIITLHTGVSEWPSWSRGFDYYPAAAMVWLEADQIIRQRSKGARSLDDFAKRFFGVRDGDWGELTYTLQDVIADMNAVEPYDWAGFFNDRIYTARVGGLDAGVKLGGYKLAFGPTLNAYNEAASADQEGVGLSYSLGMGTDGEGKITNVRWDSPAFRAGLRSGDQILAIGDRGFDADTLEERVKEATKDSAPISLLVKSGETVRRFAISYTGGLRYARLDPVGSGTRGLDALIAPK